MRKINITEKIIYEAVKKAFKNVFGDKPQNHLHLIDLSKVPEEELRKHYVDYGIWHLKDGFGSPFIRIAEDIQGNRFTWDADYVVQSLTTKYILNGDWQITKVTGSNKVPIIIAIADIGKNFDMVASDMANAGYHLGYSYAKEERGMRWQILQFEPLYPNVTDDLIRNNPTAYHWTPWYNLENIKKNGFAPSSNNSIFSYPPRVYFLAGSCTTGQLFGLGNELYKANHSMNNDGNYALIRIDTENIPANIVFYLDPNMENAMYTYDTIPPTVISTVKRYNFKEINTNEESKA